MISFCVLCMSPSNRRGSASKKKKVIIELYSSYNEIRTFDTDYKSIGLYSQYISNKYSLNQLAYSVILNGNINVYGRTIHESGNNYLLLIYYKNSNYISYLNKSTTSSVQLLDDAISTFMNIFLNNNDQNNITPVKVLKNIQNTVDLLQLVNAQTASHKSSELVYWDNKCKHYTQTIINNTPNKKSLRQSNLNVFTDHNIYDHQSKRYSDFFAHSKYRHPRKNSFHGASNSQNNLLKPHKYKYKWTRKSTTSIPQIDTIQNQTSSNTIEDEKEPKLDSKYENKLNKIKTEMIDLFELCNELRLNKNDENDNESKETELEELPFYNPTINERDLISQSKTDSLDFTSNATMATMERRTQSHHKIAVRVNDLKLKPRGIANFKHHRKMSDVLLEFQAKYQKAGNLKVALINNLKTLLSEIQNDILPSFDNESSVEKDSDNENEYDVDEELKEKCFNWLKLLSIQMNVNDINYGLKLMKTLFESATPNNESMELYNQMYDKISKYLPYVNTHTNATATPYNTPNISRINTPNISRASSVNTSSSPNTNTIITTPVSINNVRIIKEDFASEFNDNTNDNRRRIRHVRHNRVTNDSTDGIGDSGELKQQFNDMMGTIGDDTQFKQKLTELFVEISNDYANGNDNDIYFEERNENENENENKNNMNENIQTKKRESLIIYPIKTNFVEKIIQLETDVELNNKYFNLLPNWDFDAISFSNHNKVRGNCVVLLAWHLIKKNNYDSLYGISANKLINFLYQIQQSYQANNFYHNSMHACDVINNIYWFINTNFVKSYLNSFDKFICILAAAIHDVNHDGKNNSYHARTKSYLAIRYNDQSILENYHIAYSFKLISSKTDYDWIGDLKDEKVIEKTRKYLIQLVLGTDMSFHKKHLNNINGLTKKVENNMEIKEGDKIDLLCIILHACDIGNAAKKRDLCVEWAKRCIDEFRIQGDDELRLFGKESQLLFSRKHPLQKSQVGWITFVMLPYFEALNKLLNNDIKHLMDNLNSNCKQWAKYKEHIHEQKDDK